MSQIKQDLILDVSANANHMKDWMAKHDLIKKAQIAADALDGALSLSGLHDILVIGTDYEGNINTHPISIRRSIKGTAPRHTTTTVITSNGYTLTIVIDNNEGTFSVDGLDDKDVVFIMTYLLYKQFRLELIAKAMN